MAFHRRQALNPTTGDSPQGMKGLANLCRSPQPNRPKRKIDPKHLKYHCTNCGADPGDMCKTAQGRTSQEIHVAREAAAESFDTMEKLADIERRHAERMKG